MNEQLDWYLYPEILKRMLPTISIELQKPVIFECFGSFSSSRYSFRKVRYKIFFVAFGSNAIISLFRLSKPAILMSWYFVNKAVKLVEITKYFQFGVNLWLYLNIYVYSLFTWFLLTSESLKKLSEKIQQKKI